VIGQLLPQPIDNAYRGHKLALWLFALLLFMRVAMSVNSIFNASDVVGILALVRYRSMIPLIFALFLLEYLSRRLILLFSPIIRTGTPPGFYVNLVLLAVMLLGLALSLRSRGNLELQVGERRP
jgi:hypothetical protein